MPSKRNSETAAAAVAQQEPQTLQALNRQIAASEPLTPGAPRAVLGEGPEGALVAFVGEQPGDLEEREGRPFVGPAGLLLNRALSRSASIARRFTSPMPSSISSSNSAANGACIGSRRRAR